MFAVFVVGGLRLELGLRTLALAWLSASIFVALPARAHTDTPTQPKNEQRRQELRSIVRQPTTPASVVPAERHLNAQERADLRKQLSRELRAQAALVPVR